MSYTCLYCLHINVVCLFVLNVVYTWKSCTQLPFWNNAWYSCLNDMNPWNNKVCMDLERIHEAYKFVMLGPSKTIWPNTHWQ